ncbi:hypothetical protein [Psychroserpens sp. MEBiC05023]
MKVVFGTLFIVFFLQSGFAQYAKIPLTSISEAQKALAKEFVDKTIINCEEITSMKLTSKIATSRFRKFYNKKRLKERCHWYVDRYGEVETAELIEGVRNNELTILRFKVKRQLAEWFMETRVILDEKDKLAILRTKGYWADTFYSRREDPPMHKIDTSKLDKKALKLNTSFALKSYQTCESSQMFVVNNDNAVHRSLRNDWNNELLIECDSIKQKNGALSDFKFVEFYSDSISRNVYRYKVMFDKLTKPSEIRVYTKHNDKFMGVFVIDVWYDKFYEFDKAKSKALNDLGR